MIRDIVHLNINVTDIECSIAFYEKIGFKVMHVFGDQPTDDVSEGMSFGSGRMRGAVITTGDHPRSHTKIELVQWLSPTTEASEPRSLYAAGVSRIALRTKNLLAFYASLCAQGVEFEDEPQEIDIVGATRFVLLRDPDGVVIEFIEFA